MMRPTCIRCACVVAPAWKTLNGVCEDCTRAVLNGAPLIPPACELSAPFECAVSEECMEALR